MSAASATSTRDLPHRPHTPRPLSGPLSAYLAGSTALTVGLLGVGLWWDRDAIFMHGWAPVAWVCGIALVGLAAIPSVGETQLSLDMPLAIAASFTFGPWVGGAIAFLGYCDTRELRREIPLLRGLFNRSQVALSVIIGGLVFRGLSPGGIRWPGSLVAAALAVAADAIVNYALVVTAKTLHERSSPLETLLALRLGAPGSFALTYLSYGLMSIVLAEVFRGAGLWGLASFAMPVLLAHATFQRARLLEVAHAKLHSQGQALRDASIKLVDERRDERLAIAADLHDEVLPPLFQVHLMAQVIRQDLAGGRLLALEEDVPALVDAVDRASSAVRGLVQGLRRSPLGTAGFERTVSLLINELRSLTSAEFDVDTEEVDGPAVVQLLAYQVVREALYNAVRHSGASLIRVRVRMEEGALRILVEDDGAGFDPRSIDRASHFGLTMMKERVDLMGGVLHVRSVPGQGTTIVARLPTGGSYPSGGA